MRPEGGAFGNSFASITVDGSGWQGRGIGYGAIGFGGAFASIAVDGSGWKIDPLLSGSEAGAWHLVEVQSDGGRLTCRIDNKPAHFERSGELWTIRPGVAP